MLNAEDLTNVKDRIVKNPHRYKLVPVPGKSDTYDLIAKPGEVTEPGTPINRALFEQINENITAVGTPPSYIWIEYDITQTGVLPWNLYHTPINRRVVYGIDKFSYTADAFYNGINFDSATGKITGAGSPHAVQIRADTEPHTVDLWELDSGGTWYHIVKVERSYDNQGSRCALVTGDEYLTARLTYNITYGAIKSIHLTEQTGNQFRRIPVYR